MDDYFYPYESYNDGEDFPDDRSWHLYQNSGGELSRGDWRREHVNDFVKRAYEAIKKEKPHVKFGISPFGIWRPGFPQSVVGMDQYDKLYADAKLWLNKGWVDYFSPQLYWKISQLGQSFPELLGWWQEENRENRHLWPGINVNFGKEWDTGTEILNQIMITRGMLPNSKGTIHWSIGPLMKNESLSEALLEGPYRDEALVPPSPWLNNTPPQQPTIKVAKKEKDNLTLQWSHPNEKEVFKWVL